MADGNYYQRAGAGFTARKFMEASAGIASAINRGNYRLSEHRREDTFPRASLMETNRAHRLANIIIATDFATRGGSAPRVFDSICANEAESRPAQLLAAASRESPRLPSPLPRRTVQMRDERASERSTGRERDGDAPSRISRWRTRAILAASIYARTNQRTCWRLRCVAFLAPGLVAGEKEKWKSIHHAGMIYGVNAFSSASLFEVVAVAAPYTGVKCCARCNSASHNPVLRTMQRRRRKKREGERERGEASEGTARIGPSTYAGVYERAAAFSRMRTHPLARAETTISLPRFCFRPLSLFPPWPYFRPAILMSGQTRARRRETIRECADEPPVNRLLRPRERNSQIGEEVRRGGGNYAPEALAWRAHASLPKGDIVRDCLASRASEIGKCMKVRSTERKYFRSISIHRNSRIHPNPTTTG